MKEKPNIIPKLFSSKYNKKIKKEEKNLMKIINYSKMKK